MIVYATLCCKRKNTSLTPQKSIDLYISGRIKGIYKKSIIHGVNFRIFSGKFGLLKPKQKIYYYDEKLLNESIPRMVGMLKKQMEDEKILEIILFTYNPVRNKGCIPYLKALKEACALCKIVLKIRFL